MENEEPEASAVLENNMFSNPNRINEKKVMKKKTKPNKKDKQIVFTNEQMDIFLDAPYHDIEWGTPDPIEPEDSDPHGWIQLYSGRKFYTLKPRVEDIDIEDISHSLSNMCRFTGHVKQFYSVAQHSVLVSHLCGDDNALYGLLHDASEAYLVDMPRPIKRLETFSNFRAIEHNIMSIIAKKFGLPDIEPSAVKAADIKILATEARDLMAPLHPDWIQPCEPYPFKIDPLPPAEAKDLFMDRYIELTHGKNY